MIDFLNKVEFTDETIKEIEDNCPDVILNMIIEQKKLVMANIEYLKSIGIENVEEIFIKYFEIFLMDHSSFIEIFEKYDRKDLIEYLKNNINVIEYL